jgi:hypothetical protein
MGTGLTDASRVQSPGYSRVRLVQSGQLTFEPRVKLTDLIVQLPARASIPSTYRPDVDIPRHASNGTRRTF